MYKVHENMEIALSNNKLINFHLEWQQYQSLINSI